MSGGQPMDPSTRNSMEEHFQRDLHGVRLHADATAQAQAASLGAKAFTAGNNIWFGPGHGPGDRRLLKHELAHVMQQAQGQTNGLDGTAGDPALRASLEHEAEQASRNARITSPSNHAHSREKFSQVASAVQLDREDSPAAKGFKLPKLPEMITVEGAQTRKISTRSREFFQSYADFNISTIKYYSTPEPNLKPEYSRFWVTYENGKKAEFELDRFPRRTKVTQSSARPAPNLLHLPQITSAPLVFDQMGGIIFPKLYNDETAPNMMDVANSIRFNHEQRAWRLQFAEVVQTFASLIATTVATHQTVTGAVGPVSEITAGVRRGAPKAKAFIAGKLGKISGKGSTSVPPGFQEEPMGGGSNVPGETAQEAGTPQPSSIKKKGIPSTGTAGGRKASAQALAKTEKAASSKVQLTASEEAIANELLVEHSQDAQAHPEAVRRVAQGAVAKPKEGEDVILRGGKRREFQVIEKASTWDDISRKAADKSRQAGQGGEIYLQINSPEANRSQLVKQAAAASRLGSERNPSLSGKRLVLMGPTGEVWWNGVFK
jgi:hypothetical protein